MDVVTSALTWIGTPYLHQASRRGVGADCLGLVRGVWRECYGAEPMPVPPYTEDWAEPQHDEVLARVAHYLLRPVARERDLLAGELLLFRMRDDAIAKHLGIVSRAGTQPAFVHAYSGHGVVESSLSAPWLRRIAGRFDFPEVS